MITYRVLSIQRARPTRINGSIRSSDLSIRKDLTDSEEDGGEKSSVMMQLNGSVKAAAASDQIYRRWCN